MADRIASPWRRRPAPAALSPLVLDAAIAVLCYLATVALPTKAAEAAGWSLYVWAAVASLPLVWRRRRPIAVTVVVGVGTVGLAVTGALDGIPLPYGQLVATYTFAALASPTWRMLAMIGTAVGVVASGWLVLGQSPATLGTSALPFVAAYAWGAGVQARRDRISMLEERARRQAEEQQAGTARERERIAREIHDIVAHSVSIMVVQAEAGQVLAGEPGRGAAAFETISATGREALTQLDRALGVLRGTEGGTRQPQPGLDEIPELVRRARLAGLDATLDEAGERPVPPADLAAAVYRIVQEAVTNTIRHGNARRLSVRLRWGTAAVDVSVADDGRGPPTPDGAGRATRGTGHGLIGMRERVHAFGGRLRTGAGPGGVGYRIEAHLPLRSVETTASALDPAAPAHPRSTADPGPPSAVAQLGPDD